METRMGITFASLILNLNSLCNGKFTFNLFGQVGYQHSFYDDQLGTLADYQISHLLDRPAEQSKAFLMDNWMLRVDEVFVTEVSHNFIADELNCHRVPFLWLKLVNILRVSC